MKIDYIAKKFSTFIVTNPKKILFLYLLILISMVPGLFKIKANYTPRIWFNKDHAQIKALDQFEKDFGNDQKIIIGIHNEKGIFNAKTINLIKNITDELWKVSDIVRVESLANHNLISAEEDDINIIPFLEDSEQTNLEDLKQTALSDEVIPDYVLSYDGTYTLIYGYLSHAYNSKVDYSQVVNETQLIINKYKDTANTKLFLLGDATAAEAFRDVADRDNKKIIPFMLIIILILLLYLFRNIIGLIIPNIISVSTIGITFGIIGYLDITYNSMLAAIPGILLAICLADAVHILTSYFHYISEGKSNIESLTKSLEKNFVPTILTTITTMISFLSISVSEIQPIHDLGLMAAFGTMTAWLMSYLIIGSTFSLFDNYMNKQAIKISNKNGLHQTTNYLTNLIYKHKKIIIFTFSIITIVSFSLSLKNEVNSDPIKYFDKSLTIRKAYDFISTKLNGLRGVELVADSGIKEGVKNPEFLRKVEKYIEWLKKDPSITQVKSILEVIKKLNQVVHQDNKTYYQIPETQKEVAELLFLYSIGLPQGMDLNNQITLDNSKLRFRVVWDIETSKESSIKLDKILLKAKEFDLNISAGGNLPIYIRMNNLIVSSFFQSLISALILVTILIFFLFRDIKIALLSMLPNLIPIILGGALLFVMGHFIDIGTSMVIVVCLGIAVDDTIHFIVNYLKQRNKGNTTKDSIINTFLTTGKALIITTILLVAGFGSFIFADFVPNQKFGILCSIILTVALLTDLLFLPAILFVLDKDDH